MVVKLDLVHVNLLKNIAKNNGFKNFEILAEENPDKANPYTGNIVKILIDDKNKKLHLLLKKADENDAKFPSERIRIRNVYLKEIYIYEQVLEIFDQFQIENGLVNGFKGHAKLFGSCVEERREALVLENLTESGYKLWDRKSPMDPNHVELVMREYGKLHAVSFAMRHKQPELFAAVISEYLAAPFDDTDREAVIGMLKSTATTLPEIVKGNEDLEKAVQRLLEGANEFFASLMDNPQWLVVRHGDCWCNNILFKYEDSKEAKKPTRVCLIDWQISRLGPGTLDLVYHFYTSSSKAMLYDYQTYLRAYYDSFSKSLRGLSCDANQIFPYDSLVKQFRHHSKFSLFLAPAVFNILLAEGDNLPDMRDNQKTREEYFGRLNAIGDKSAVNGRILDLLKFMVDNDMV